MATPKSFDLLLPIRTIVDDDGKEYLSPNLRIAGATVTTEGTGEDETTVVTPAGGGGSGTPSSATPAAIDASAAAAGAATTYSRGDHKHAITDATIALGKLADIPYQRILGRFTAGAGPVEALTPTQARANLNIADGAAAVASSGTPASVATSASLGAASTAARSDHVHDLAANVVALGKLAQIATARFLGRVTGSTGDVEALTGAQATTLLDVATTTLKGLMSAADKVILDAATSAATANALVKRDASARISVAEVNHGTLLSLDAPILSTQPTTNGSTERSTAEVDAADGAATQIGSTFALDDDTTYVVDVVAVASLAGNSLVRIHHVRRAFAVAGAVVVDGAQVDVSDPMTIGGGTLASAVNITRTGASARVEVRITGEILFADPVRWRVVRQIERLVAMPVPPPDDLSGMVFAGSQAYYGPATASAALGTARVRFRLDSLPPASGFHIVAGTSTGASGGWLVCWEDTYTGSDYGQLTVYAGIGGVLTRLARKFFMPNDVGRVFTLHITCDGDDAFVYLDGHKIAPGVAATSIESTTNRMNLGGNSSGTNSAAVTIVDVAEGTTALTPAEVAEDAALDTPSFADQAHRWTMSTTPGATWEDEVGSFDLTRVGSPTSETFTPTFARHARSIEVWGDSIAAGRQSDTTAGDGWNRALQRLLPTSYERTTTWIGKSPKGASATRDFDFYTSATGGEALNDRLATLAADLATYAPADCATFLAYGINDIVALDRTAEQLAADVETAVGLIATARPGAPIFVCNVLSVAAAAATSGEHAEVATYQAGFPALIASLQETYPQVVGVDYGAVITDPEDTAQLYDGTHPSPATYAAIAASIADQIASFLDD